MNDEVDALRRMAIFAAVVEAQSFSEAGRRLNLAKSAVSKQIAELEQNLGVRLMNRTTRRLNLTEAGERFYQSCSRILEEATQATRAVRDLQDQPLGTLRLNAPVFFGSEYVMPVVARYMRDFTEVQVEVQLEDGYVDLIDAQVDLTVRIGALEDSSLVARKLAPIDMVLVASPELLEERGVPETPDDLGDLPWVAYTLSRSPHRVTLHRNGEPTTLRMSGRLTTNSGSATLRAVEHGLAIAPLPAFYAASSLRAGKLVRLLPEYELQPNLAAYAVYPHTRHVQAKVRVFVDYLVEAFGTPPWAS